jgi:UDP-GlcNAc3NAcA epimerase
VHHEILIHTGQHYDYEMSDIFFKEMDIPKPDYNLGIGSGAHGYQTGKMMNEIEKVLLDEKPDCVIVYGDTNSTLAGALVAAKMCIKVVHVEAGLRSFDKTMPEEINRKLTDHASDILFCPTHTGVKNLEREGIVRGVYFVGDVMLDALNFNRKIAQKNSQIIKNLELEEGNYFVITVHRPSNTENKKNMENIIEALVKLKRKVIFPVHPRTKKSLIICGLWEKIPENVILIPPLGYLDMLNLLQNADKILTDSGGIQKEAYILGVQCITLRDNTEWVETLEDGWNSLVGASVEKILEAINKSKPKKEKTNIFGNGDASKIICKNLQELM